MTIKELKILLSALPEDANVMIPDGYHTEMVTHITNPWYDKIENELWLTNFDK